MKIEYNLKDIKSAAKQIITSAKSHNLLFEAKMGIGKTTLIKELVKQLGSTDRVSSPTFSLVNEYITPTDILYHFDFYRIEDEVEALDIGFEDYLDRGDWIFIEWPHQIPNLWPEEYQLIKIERIGNNKNCVMLQ